MQTLSSRLSLRRALLCALLPVLAPVVTGCGKHAETSNAAASNGALTASASVDSPPPAPVGPPVSDADAKQFTDRLTTAIRGSDVTTVNSLLDLDAIASASTAGLGLSDKDRTDFVGGLRSSMNQSTGITSQLIASVANGGHADLLRFVEADRRKRVRLRMVHPNSGGVGYVDFVLGHNATGQTVAQDMYIFYSGELISKTIRRLAVQAVASQNRSLLEKLQGVDSDFVKHFQDIQTMSQDLNTGNAPAAMQIYNTLPDTLKADKTIKLIHIRIAEKVGETEYQSALADFRASFPNDPATDLLSIDYYLLKKQYGKSLTAIDGLDKSVGGDPYLDILRSEVYYSQKDLSKARAALARGIQAVPNDKGAQRLQAILTR